MTQERFPDTEERLNFKIERRLDSLALVVLLYNDNNIEISDIIAEHLDEIGHVLLNTFKVKKGFTSEQVQEMVMAFTAMLEEERKTHTGRFANVPRA